MLNIQKLRITVLFFLIFIPKMLSSQVPYRVKTIQFQGNQTISSDRIKQQMNTEEKSGVEKFLFWKKAPEFILPVFENDLARIRRYYQRNGFLNTEINYQLDSLIERKKIKIYITIDEKENVKLKSIQLTVHGDKKAQNIADSLGKELQADTNQRFIDERIYATRSGIQSAFQNQGYPMAEVDLSTDLIAEKQQARVTFKVKSGPRSYFGPLSISSDSIFPNSYLRKQVSFSPGEMYDQKEIFKTQERLFNTGLFKNVLLIPYKDSIMNQQIPIHLRVKEMPPWSLEAGAGYGTEDLFRFSLQISKLGFLGGARRLLFQGKTSYYEPYHLNLSFIQPNFIFYNNNLIFSNYIKKEKEESYEVERIGSRLSLQYRINNQVETGVSYMLEKNSVDILKEDAQNEVDQINNKSSISIGGKYNSSSDEFLPGGTKLNVNFSYTGLGIKANYKYYKADVLYRKYFDLTEGIKLAGKVKWGVIQPVGSSVKTPLEERYLLGGASSLRGWGRHEIALLSEDSLKTGGNSALEGSLELRFPIYDIFGAAVFMDMGNIWSKFFQYELQQLHYSLGAGLRIQTPIGPVRIDFASPVINDDFDFQFYISIGQAF